MVDVNRVSQNVKDLYNEIASKDGQKGISNQEERNALADLLSSGKVSGKYNVEYIQGEIIDFDLKEAAKNASDFVKNAIEKAKEMAGDKNAIDDVLELAVLDKIIDNPNGDYSPEDVQYAKLLKAQSQYAGQKSHETLLREENAALIEQNAELMEENRALKMELEKNQQQATKTSSELEKAMVDFNAQVDVPATEAVRDAAKNVAAGAAAAVSAGIQKSLKNIAELSSQTTKLLSAIDEKQTIAAEGKLSKTTFESFMKQTMQMINENKKKIAAEKEKVKTDAVKLNELLTSAGAVTVAATVSGILAGVSAGAAAAAEEGSTKSSQD